MYKNKYFFSVSDWSDFFNQLFEITNRLYVHVQGTHEALNFYFDNEKFTIPQVYGEYMAEMTLYKDEEKLLCLLCYYDIVPKSN